MGTILIMWRNTWLLDMDFYQASGDVMLIWNIACVIILLALTYTCVHVTLASTKKASKGTCFIKVRTPGIYNIKFKPHRLIL
jgi:uncharacterized RDD family membrane protein YckC